MRRASTQPVKNHLEQFIPQKPPTTLQHEHFSVPIKTGYQNGLAAKSFLNRPAVEHVKVKSYNYGVPTNRRSRSHPPRATYQHESNARHGSVFVSSLHPATDTISYGKPAEIYVYARKRPLLSSEKTFEDTIAVPDNQRIIIAENKANLDCTPLLKKTEFQFDQVFGSDAPNKQVFESTVLPFISTDHRHNLTYICFGQTGSGKSHTIFGSKNTDGLLIYCTQLLLREVDDDHKLSCSFYEIYNNQVYDLVNGGKRLFVREDGEHHVNVIGITEFLLKSLENLRCVIDEGLARRHHGKSAFNSNSSRSHAVFQITLHNNDDATENFRLIFIDLAGSERATDAQNNLRQTRREGAQINWSLLALKECIRSMDLTHSHAPFRQSKLTHILRDSLIGSKTRTCLMANVSPPNDCCQCSLNTLQYASRIRDISIRHRHRTMVTASVPVSSTDDTLQQEEMLVPEKPQRTFKPATVSTPVHRLISSVDSHIYTPTHPAGTDSRKTKPLDIDWQIADDDIPITGGGGNRLVKSLTSSKRDFKLNSHTNGLLQSNRRPLNRLHEKKSNDFAQSPSSYFPMPQSDIKKSSPNKTTKETRLYDSTRLMYDDGNERRWKGIPSALAHRLSGASIEAPVSTRAVPVVPMQTSDDQVPSSAVVTESLGTKITKAATGSRRHRKSSTYNGLVESLNLNRHYDTADVEPVVYSDRQGTYRDQTGFFTNRDELLSIVSSRLTSVSQRSSSVATPKRTKTNSQSNIPNASQSNKSKSLFSSSSSLANRTQPKSRSTKPTSSLAYDNQMKKLPVDNKKFTTTSSWDPTNRHSSARYQRSAPLRIDHSSDSADDDEENTPHNLPRRKAYSSKTAAQSTRSEGCHTTEGLHVVKREQDQADDYLRYQPVIEQNPTTKSIEPLSSFLAPTSTTLPIPLFSPGLVSKVETQVPLDQPKTSFDWPSTNIDNPWTLSTSFGSPSKEFAVRVSDQLNALRSLLETHLVEPTQANRSPKDVSDRPLSPSTFAREFLKSCRESPLKTNTMAVLSDDDDREVASSFGKTDINVKLSSPSASSNQYGFLLKHHYEHIIQPSLLSLSDKLAQAKASSIDTAPVTSTMTTNLAAKIASQDSPSHHADAPLHPLASASNPASDSERTSQGHSTGQNPFTGTSSDGSSANRSLTHSPLVVPPFSTFDITNRINADQGGLLDHEKGSSLLSTSPFNTLLNSLKSMRETDLDFAVHTGDDQLIPVAD